MALICSMTVCAWTVATFLESSSCFSGVVGLCMITPNAHTLLLGKAVYASMLVLHVLCGQGSQVDIGHIRPLMAQQPGHREVGVQSAHALVHQFLILLRCKGVAKSVEGQGRVR